MEPNSVMKNQPEAERGNSPILIRDATVEDADRMGQIAVDAWQFAYSSFVSAEFMAARSDPARRAQRIRENWRTDRDNLVAVSAEGVVIGFAIEERPGSLEGYDAEIGALYVDPKASRCGAGRLLVTEMVRRFQERGSRSMAIHTLTQNVIGCSFYEKIGGQAGPFTTWNAISSRWFVWPDLREF